MINVKRHHGSFDERILNENKYLCCKCNRNISVFRVQTESRTLRTSSEDIFSLMSNVASSGECFSFRLSEITVNLVTNNHGEANEI